MNYKEGELKRIIQKLAQVVSHQPFIDQMLEINEDICRISLWRTQNGVQHKMTDQPDATEKKDN